VRICLKKKSEEKKRQNQACEDQGQVFDVALNVNDHTTYDWIINSHITQHMTFKWKWFTTYKSIVLNKVYMGDDTILKAIVKRSIKATLYVGG
jgi:hypothetical protein